MWISVIKMIPHHMIKLSNINLFVQFIKIKNGYMIVVRLNYLLKGMVK